MWAELSDSEFDKILLCLDNHKGKRKAKTAWIVKYDMLAPKLRFKREDGTDYPEWEEIPTSEVFTKIIEKNRPDLPVLSILQGQETVYRDSSDRNIMYGKKAW